jgi:hypothetical protein
MFRTLRRLLRLLTLVPAAAWLWQERHVIAGMASFARTLPDRMRLGRGEEVALAAKVNLALLRDPQLRGADVRLGAVQAGEVCLEVGSGAEAAGEVARRVAEGVPGVTSVRVEGAQAHAAPSTTDAGDDEVVADLRDGAAESPSGGPVQI